MSDPQDQHSSTSAPRVMLVDDTPANLVALSAVLKPLGASLVEARSGAEALSAIELGGYAAVLLDVQMPEMDGFEVAARLRATEKGRDVPIVFLTAIHRDEGYARKGYESGGADYITKPFDVGILRARVKAFIDLYRSRDGEHREEVMRRTRERDEAVRRLVALERVSQLALETEDIDVFLRALLGVFMEAADSADSAAILLAEGDDLRVRASLGADDEQARSFARVVAAAHGPMLVRKPQLGADQAPVRAAYGAPLHHDGTLIGVVYVGTSRSDDISDAEKRLLSAIAERAATAVERVATHKELERVAKERIELLDRERAARADAEIANRAKDDFLATVSHELRTPLNAILGWTVTARRQAETPQLERALSIIERNARAQARIIEDVLDISRIISGKLRLEMTAANVADAIAGAVETVRPGAEGKGVALAVFVGDIGTVAGDADRIQQVVWNVLSNAIKFTPPGGRVTVEAERVGGKVVIAVTDTGQGIDRGFISHLFEPFRQADPSTTRRHGGLGLGLAIVKEIVQAHGGTIRAESAGEGKGAKFIIELPARSLPRPISEPAAVETQDCPRLDGLSLLVVDDDEDARHLLDEIFTSCGAKVTLAASAREALAFMAESIPDILVSDIGMPEMDGFALIQEIRRLPPDRGGWTPAIALTAYTRHEDGRRAFASGFQAHVAKPVDPSYLVAAIANLAAATRPAAASASGSAPPAPSQLRAVRRA